MGTMFEGSGAPQKRTPGRGTTIDTSDTGRHVVMPHTLPDAQ